MGPKAPIARARVRGAHQNAKPSKAVATANAAERKAQTTRGNLTRRGLARANDLQVYGDKRNGPQVVDRRSDAKPTKPKLRTDRPAPKTAATLKPHQMFVPSVKLDPSQVIDRRRDPKSDTGTEKSRIRMAAAGTDRLGPQKRGTASKGSGAKAADGPARRIPLASGLIKRPRTVVARRPS